LILLQVKTTEQQVLADAEKTTEKYGLEAGLYKVGAQLSRTPAQPQHTDGSTGFLLMLQAY
jgi:hypothetical protein